MTTVKDNSAEGQAARLETANREIAALLRRPDVAQRLRAAGQDEWSALEIVGHMNEMIPYWMGHIHALAAAAGAPPQFGRAIDAPERLEGVQRAAKANPEELLGVLDREIRAAAADIRRMPATERAKKGIHSRIGEVTVAGAIEQLVVDHAEAHVEQLKQAIGAEH